ncbi:MAG TPA: redoxin domain-containing protein [Gemmataceae bacterium]|nr:redoxin domain-containing protein [Gemmataceae bacterium]
MDTSTSPAATSRKMPRGALLFGISLILVGLVYVGIVVRHALQAHAPETAVPAPEQRDLAAEAKALVRQSKPAPLSESMEKLLTEAERNHVASQQHPLLGKPAPDFSRPDVYGNVWSLHEALQRGPVVVIFYYGYHCNHCVSQLFDASEDYRRFRELGAEVVALSADDSELTRKRYQQYGAFTFPVLADHGNKIAQAYGTYHPAENGQPEQLDHGTFIIDQNGIVRWAFAGDAPFSDNRTLFWELNQLRKK